MGSTRGAERTSTASGAFATSSRPRTSVPDPGRSLGTTGCGIVMARCQMLEESMAVKTDPTESLRRVPLFAGLDRKELEMLGKLIKEQRYATGATIVKSGAGGHGLYIIREGNVAVIRDGQRVG